ncbi:Uncharacterized protein Rs2_14971 [Raphanus sativus]|nr:Uncharacterized protein Rs2_14971 [Raphanus sativus]
MTVFLNLGSNGAELDDYTQFGVDLQPGQEDTFPDFGSYGVNLQSDPEQVFSIGDLTSYNGVFNARARMRKAPESGEGLDLVYDQEGPKLLVHGFEPGRTPKTDKPAILDDAIRRRSRVSRFRIELVFESGDRTTKFVLFDRDAKKITHTTAEEITALEEREEGDNRDHQKVPKCLLDIIGKTMDFQVVDQKKDFQVKIAEYNFKASFQTFTVTKKNSILQANDDPMTAKTKQPKKMNQRCMTISKKMEKLLLSRLQVLVLKLPRKGKNETEDVKKQAMDEVTTENETKK